MARIDDFINEQVKPMLGPGEEIRFMGFASRPIKFNAFRVPEKYLPCIHAATTSRLIVFETDASGIMTVTPAARRDRTMEWDYRDLREVAVGPVGGLGTGVAITLVPHDSLGPCGGQVDRYDALPPTGVAEVDGQAAFHATFPGWLKEQVAKGAFPMDADRKARVEAYKAQQAAAAAAAAEEARLRAEAWRARKEAMLRRLGVLKTVRPSTWAVVVLVLAGLGVLGLAYYENDHTRFYERGIESTRQASEATWNSPAERERQRSIGQRYQAELEEEQASVTQHTILGILLIGGAVGVIVWRLKRRAA